MLNSVIARRPDTADAYISLAHAYWEGGRPQLAISSLEHALVERRAGPRRADPAGDLSRRNPRRQREGDHAPRRHVDGGRGGAERTGHRLRRRRPLCRRDRHVQEGAGARSDQRARVSEPGVDGLAPGAGGDERPGSSRQAAGSPRRSRERPSKWIPPCPTRSRRSASCCRPSGRKSDAIDSWKRAVQIDPSQFNALYNLWFELAAAGRRDEASAYGRQFVATAPPAFFQPDIDRIKRYLAGG